MILNCPNCGTQNVAGAKFCMECASPLASGCPNCGFQNLPGAKFCSECATPLGGDRAALPPPQAAAPPAEVEAVAQRRIVSVLFADLVGFTPFAEGKDSEDVRDTLTRYFDISREVVERYGGTVEKFIGDAVMAVWGAPTAHEDDAERAVRAALELVDAVPALGSGIQARAGVLTGEAAVTVGATNQGLVAGDIVNTASRLQSVAPPGAVLVGDVTQRSAAAAIHFEPAGEQVLKGKEAPVVAWRAVRVVAERGGRNRSDTLEAPFVGRQEEMRLLKELLHNTGRERRLRVVSIIGPAGIGKSRLSWEFSKYTDGLVEDIYWHTGRSPAYGEGITFWALGEMVRERCGLRELDDETTTRAKVRETVERWIDNPDDRSWIEGALLTLLGVEASAAPDQLFGAWRTFFESIAQKGTTCLIFEDMHFADAGLLDFVDHMLEWSRELPIYIVTLARPDLIERRQDWGAGKRNFVSMYLEPLTDEQMRELLEGLVPGLPDQAVKTIIARADGIPLYAVETVRTLVAEGRVVLREGVYAPEGDLTTLSVPETLAALIASRLDTLEETDRRLIHDAAVLGQSFTAAALSAVAGVAVSEIEPRLGGLVRRELLQRQMDARSPERGQYEFVQALIREVAYNTLSKKDRKKLHVAAARYFESLGSDEIAGALASHYLAAHANSAEGEEADALAGQARIALKAAATRAAALGSYDQAVSFLDQALSVTTDAHEQVELLIESGSHSRIAGRTEQAIERARRARDIATNSADRSQMLRATVLHGNMLSAAYRPDEAAPVLEAAIADFPEADEESVAALQLALARTDYTKGKYRESLVRLETVLEIAERRGDVHTVAMALIARGNALWSFGRRREAFGTSYVARDLAIEHGMVDVQLRVMGNLANTLTETDAAAALTSLREAIVLARKVGQRGSLIQSVGNLGYAGFLAGAWDESLAELDVVLADDLAPNQRLVVLNNALIIRASRGESIQDGIDELRNLGTAMSGQWEMFVKDPVANEALASGDLATARNAFMALGEDDLGVAIEYFYRAGRAALWATDLADSKDIIRRLEETGAYGPVAEARLATLRAGVAALEGRTKEALALYREALTGWRATHSPYDEALTGLDMAKLLDPSEPEVADAIKSTREILERLRAKPFLELLDAAEARGGDGPAGRQAPATRAEVAVTPD